jgi:hypothetical protein
MICPTSTPIHIIIHDSHLCHYTTVNWPIHWHIHLSNFQISHSASSHADLLFNLVTPQIKKITAILNDDTATWPNNFFPHGATAPSGPPHYRGFTITLRHTTLVRTRLDELSARRRDLYLTTHNTHNRQTSMLAVGFEPAIPASERLQTHALDCTATGIGQPNNTFT